MRSRATPSPLLPLGAALRMPIVIVAGCLQVSVAGPAPVMRSLCLAFHVPALPGARQVQACKRRSLCSGKVRGVAFCLCAGCPVCCACWQYVWWACISSCLELSSSIFVLGLACSTSHVPLYVPHMGAMHAQGFRTAEEVQRFSDMMDEMCYIVATKHSGSLKARPCLGACKMGGNSSFCTGRTKRRWGLLPASSVFWTPSRGCAGSCNE